MTTTKITKKNDKSKNSVPKHLRKGLEQRANKPRNPIIRQPKEKYTLIVTMGAETAEVKGNDSEIFSKARLSKFTNKTFFTLINNENKKTYEVAMPPIMARKLATNSYVQKFQWKRFAGKVE